MASDKSTLEIPTAAAFRHWLAAALNQVEVKPATLSRAIDAGVNTVGAFLKDPERDITISRAAALERYLRELAATQGKELPLMMAREGDADA